MYDCPVCGTPMMDLSEANMVTWECPSCGYNETFEKSDEEEAD